MNEKNIIFDDIEVNKSKRESKRESYGKKTPLKYFIGYNDNDDIRPLCIGLPQMIGYAKYFDSNKTMSFKVIDKKLLKKYPKLQRKISSLINK